MNEILNKFLLVGDKFMLNIHLRQPGMFTVLLEHLLKSRKENKKFEKQETHDIFIKTNHIKLAFKMTWLMEI